MILKSSNLSNEKEDRYFKSQINDLLNRHKHSMEVLFTQFLSEYEISLALSVLENRVPFSLWGGYNGAERQMISVGESENDFFPICCIEVSNNKKSVALSHRNILGSLMSLGIERSVIGDIIVNDEHSACFFCNERMSGFILENLESISRDSCILKIVDSSDISFSKQKFEEFQVSVASPRLDCFVSSITNISRKDVKEMISDGLIFLNSKQEQNPEKSVSDGDVLSVRGYGKFIVDSYLKQSRKGKLQYKIRKFS